MANISSLLEIIRTAHLGRDMRQALHDSIEAVNNDTETALGKTLAFNTTTRKLTLKAKDNSALSEVVIPGGGSGGGSVDSVNGLFPDENGNVEVNLNDINDVDITSAADGQLLGYDNTSGKWKNVNAPSGGGGHTIKNESGTALTQRNNLQFKGCSVSDDSTNNATVVSVQTSNRNLLDNAWFTVNQKGVTSGTFGASRIFDRWKVDSGGNQNNTWALSNGILTIDTTSYSGTGWLIQIIENGLEIGKQYTFSVLLSDNTIESYTKTIVSGTTTFTTSGKWNSIQYISSSNEFDIVVKTNQTVSIKAVKLEVGGVSTLAFDTAPDYATELLKCQRYLQKIDDSIIQVSLESLSANNKWLGRIDLKTPMRATPTFTYTSASVYLYNGTYSTSDACTVTMTAKTQSIEFKATTTETGANGSCGRLTINGGWLDAQL